MHRVRSKILIICLSLFFACQLQIGIAAGTDQSIKVGFLSPVGPGTPFWDEVISFMQAVAEDLNMEIVVKYSKNNTYSTKKYGLELLSGPDKPQYFVTGYWVGVTDRLLSEAQAQDIKVFLFNTLAPVGERINIGTPRGKFKNWIGSMAPNDEKAGYDLARILVKQAQLQKLTDDDGKVQMVGLSGDASSDVANLRNVGLQRLHDSSNNTVLHQIISSTWDIETARRTTVDLLEAFPDAKVLWTVGDNMAMGAIDAFAELKKKPGKDILTGGMDWTSEALNAIANGTMAASMGGHFMEAGWVAVLIHDYHHGLDFVDDVGIEITTPMQAITAKNVKQYQESFGTRNWKKLDFSQFSKKRNPSLQKYDFSLDALLKAANH